VAYTTLCSSLLYFTTVHYLDHYACGVIFCGSENNALTVEESVGCVVWYS